jgi:hypothetical protein
VKISSQSGDGGGDFFHPSKQSNNSSGRHQCLAAVSDDLGAAALGGERFYLYTFEVSYTFFLNIFAGSRNSASYQRGIVVWGRNNSAKNYRRLVGGYGQ